MHNLLSSPAILAVFAFAGRSTLMAGFFRLGAVGLFLLSIVDASFVPLPLPGASDLLIALLAARQHAWLILTLAATAGSVLGGAACYYVGSLGGVHMLEKRVPAKYFSRITRWVEKNAFLAVAIPAILPPPFPLIPFVLAAGALKMPKRKFYIAFTISRALRHALFAWIGLHYANKLKFVWTLFESRWATVILIIFWIAVIGAVIYGIWSLVRTTRANRSNSRQPEPA
jgi:membrane protein YqaA with SNARE-associated domain